MYFCLVKTARPSGSSFFAFACLEHICTTYPRGSIPRAEWLPVPTSWYVVQRFGRSRETSGSRKIDNLRTPRICYRQNSPYDYTYILLVRNIPCPDTKTVPVQQSWRYRSRAPGRAKSQAYIKYRPPDEPAGKPANFRGKRRTRESMLWSRRSRRSSTRLRSARQPCPSSSHRHARPRCKAGNLLQIYYVQHVARTITAITYYTVRNPTWVVLLTSDLTVAIATLGTITNNRLGFLESVPTEGPLLPYRQGIRMKRNTRFQWTVPTPSERNTS